VNSIKRDDQKVVDESNSANKNDFRFVSDPNVPDAESVNEIDADIYGEKCTLDSSTINLCHNGGLCLMRHAFWSQTVREVTVHISVKYIVSFLKSLESSNGSSVHVDSGGSCQVDFKSNSCNIKPRESSSPDHIVNLVLSYCILPDDCTWFTTTVDSIDYIVLMLSKAPPVTEYPGCEWWDRVFEDDEKIDTMTCTVGADVSQLPEHAQLRAYQEHARFLALGRHEKEQELSALSQGKQVWYCICSSYVFNMFSHFCGTWLVYVKVFCKAELDTREKAQAEDRAVQEVPQRAGMLEALRDEFPNIQFSAK
jgi:hypothetical protein